MPRPLRCPKCRSNKVSEYGKHRVDCSVCYDCGFEFTMMEECRDLFHDLWTQAAKRDDYRKTFWERLAVLRRW